MFGKCSNGQKTLLFIMINMNFVFVGIYETKLFFCTDKTFCQINQIKFGYLNKIFC